MPYVSHFLAEPKYGIHNGCTISELVYALIKL